MKKVLTLMLAVMMITLAACAPKTDDEAVNNDNIAQTEQNNQEDVKGEEESSKEETEQKEEQEKVKTEQDKKPQQADKKPAQSTQKPAQKPEAEKNEPAPQQPQQQPEQSQKATLGNTLLSDFKAKANAGMGVQAIAEGLLQNPAILFNGGAMAVEEGMLSGFDNNEIKGFKSGYTFAPMIGSIAFVGYVFELDDAQDAPGFISKLKSSANMRWNICVEAEEMVAGSVGNKVFFVMCPKSLEE